MKYRFPYLILCLLIITGCGRKNNLPHSVFDFPEMLEKGEINALTLSGSMTYFIYKGEEMGYEYELLTDFAESNNLKINLKVAENETKLQEMLESGEGDLIACNVPVTIEGKSILKYCGREVVNEQVLIQRSNRGDTILKDVTDLIGKEVWVIHDSKYHNRLINLNNELGGGIHIRVMEQDTVSVEDLIAMVSSGKISYTLSDSDLAKLNKTYYPNINISLKVSHSQRSSWAVRKDTPELASALSIWFGENQNTPRYRRIIKRYFEMSKLPGDAPAPLLAPNRICEFDSLFRQYATKINWDWRLLASIAYQESRFYTDRVSWAGATGLMGLMPRTAEAFGVSEDELNDPEASIRGATALLKRLNSSFRDIEDQNERIKFILAAYNAGAGHINDAQALTEKYGKDPHVWNENVEEYIKLKKLPEYYNDPVCKQGYFRATETLNYVEYVIERWHYYQSKIN